MTSELHILYEKVDHCGLWGACEERGGGGGGGGGREESVNNVPSFF